jgi:hypothetical protein
MSVGSVHRFIRSASIALFSFALMILAVPFSAAQFVTPASAQVEPISVEFRTALEPYGAFRRVARWG